MDINGQMSYLFKRQLRNSDVRHLVEPDRCEGIEFDAITPDGKGKNFFFKGVAPFHRYVH